MDLQMRGRFLAFIAFTATLCFILLVASYCLIAKILTIADYKEIIIVLGIPTIIGMAFNSFFHTNPKSEDEPNAKITSTTRSAVITDAVKSTSGQPIDSNGAGPDIAAKP